MGLVQLIGPQMFLDRHRSSRYRRGRSRSPSPPLVLASDNEKLRNQDIDFIETSGFVQTSFRSSRKGSQLLKPSAETASGEGLNAIRASSSQYDEMTRERAHEAAIFGTGRALPLSLGTRPSDETAQKVVPTTQVVDQVIHPRLKKDKEVAYKEWAARLNDLANARRQLRDPVLT
ncbi:unnamed protein product [Mesocestoides corti]|uniref:Uncharacterized protein n=1 Tax=Mesocestoides corti TaxID=53468 RepID=A0A0R3U8V7_MESCO|nr:unnamed protein product [Mesocestoides corti]